jgi:hypothetical protein
MIRKKKDTYPNAASTSRPSARGASAQPASVRVDYPVEGEIVTSSRYTFRFKTPAASGVEISVDGRDFVPCRESVGFWWFDWSGYQAGPHTAQARVRTGKRWVTSDLRHFMVLV